MHSSARQPDSFELFLCALSASSGQLSHGFWFEMSILVLSDTSSRFANRLLRIPVLQSGVLTVIGAPQFDTSPWTARLSQSRLEVLARNASRQHCDLESCKWTDRFYFASSLAQEHRPNWVRSPNGRFQFATSRDSLLRIHYGWFPYKRLLLVNDLLFNLINLSISDELKQIAPLKSIFSELAVHRRSSWSRWASQNARWKELDWLHQL